MKKLGIVVILLIIGLGVFALNKEKERRLALAQNSYETGCYHSAQFSCPALGEEDKINECYQYAADHCPVMAVRFKEWLRTGK